MTEKEKFYITTAIAYTSKKPHIGNTYEIILTDAIARFKKMQGKDVFMLTGTDEHGQKIQELAEKAGIAPKAYVDNVAGEIKRIWDLMNVEYDHFVRTTDDYHEETVQKIFKKLYDQGDIYLGEYEGMYCTPCESFFTESQLVDGKCPDCGREVKPAKEEAYFLKCSKYQDRLIEYIESHPGFIEPESRKKEIMNNFLKAGLQDLCVSRTSFTWGIPVSFNPKHVTYVWIDALTNYITALGYKLDSKSELYNKNWPADVHVIGKDILRFHSIYWPIILMALGEPLPKKIYAHGWMLFGEDKMSKSKGNVIYADELAEEFGVDAVRYYSLSEMPYAQDGSITYEAVISRYNSDLANTLGNLVNRTVAMVNKYFEGTVYLPGEETEVDKDLKAFVKNMVDTYIAKMDEYRVAEAIETVMDLARRSNKYIDETTPWTLAKENTERLKTVLFNLLEAIKVIATLIFPVMPETAKKIAEQINVEELTLDSVKEFGANAIERKVGTATPLFARIDEKEKLEELTKKMEAKKEAAKAEEPKDVKEEITFDEFGKTELRVAKILTAERIEGANKLYKITVDLGYEQRTVVSGLVPYYKEDELIGKKVVLVANLKPAKLRGIESRGMILAAGEGDNVKLITVDGDMELGSIVC
ncbi:MAG: methionine--tRNA ligase [Clostridia bacterium]|nr:methionine--tRNA ligase [Clostridia bacterium]